MITLIIVGLIILIIGFICIFKCDNATAFCFGVVGAYILSGGIMKYDKRCLPTAMDVYQGKTTLEYTIKDGVVVDSVVVFKNNEK